MKKAPAKTKQELQRQKTERILDRLYLAAALALLPLVIHDGYFDITEAKTLFFVIVSAVYLLGRGVCFLQFRAAGEWPAPPREPGEIAAVCFCFISLLASIGSGFFRDSMLGLEGRWQGTAMFMLYALLYYSFRERKVRERDVIVPLCIGLFLSSLLAVGNHLGTDPLGIVGRLGSFDKGRYISTLGNINFAAAYLSLTVSAAMWYFLKTDRKPVRTALGIVSAAGLWAAMATRSESAVLGVGVGVVLLPFTMRDEPAALRRWGLLSAGIAGVMQLYRGIVWLAGGSLSTLTRAALHPAVSAAMALLGAVWFFLLGKNKGKEQRALRIYGGALAAVAAAAVTALALLNTVWREADLGAAAAWLHISDAWGTDRVMVWKHCLEFYRQFIPWDKLFGGGCGVLAEMDALDRLFPDAVLDTAHCEYLQILLNWGALGLLSYLGWLVFSAEAAFRKKNALSAALTAGLAAYAVQAAVNIAQAPGITLFFLLLALQRADGTDGA